QAEDVVSSIMNEDPEPFGGCDILEPDHDRGERSRANIGPMGKVVKKEERAITSTSAPPIVRIVKKTQLFLEPHGFSKTVTIDEEHGRKTGLSLNSSQPSSSSWMEENDGRGTGTRKLRHLTLRIGKKQMRFKVTDAPPPSQGYARDGDWGNRLHHSEATVLYSKKQCVQCNRVFNTMEEIRRHIADVHSSGPFPCSYCPRSFDTKTEQATHLRSHNNLVSKDDLPPDCPKRFRHAIHLNQHTKVHADGRQFCTICGKCFKTNDELASHHTRCLKLNERPGEAAPRVVTVNGKSLRYQCSHCTRLFHFKRDVRIHERIHTGEKPYECGYCWRSFTQSQALTSHIRIHTGEKPYPCQHANCAKSFRDSSALRKHESSHYVTRMRQTKGGTREESYEEEEGETRGEGREYQERSRMQLMSQSEMGDGELEEVEEEIVEDGEIPMEEDYYL
ncbi:hypothetical protein PENTCL1PPCAC_5655, partial [Pristionchus entomophagus]